MYKFWQKGKWFVFFLMIVFFALNVNAQTTCTDSDGGINKDVKGTTITISRFNQTTISQDVCIGNTLREYYCGPNNQTLSRDFLCQCEDGACREVFCRDDDGGINPAVKGNASRYYITSNNTTQIIETLTDRCLSQTFLQERYCRNNIIATTNIRCNCVNGACTGRPPTPPVCGNGVCEPGENATTCPQDCAICGNGVCEPPRENATTCPQDCAIIINVTIQPGWNLISTPLKTMQLNEVLGTCSGKVQNYLWKLKNNNWRITTTLEPLEGYFLYADASCVLSFLGQDHSSPISRELSRGWNIISSKKSWNDIKGNCILDGDAIYEWVNTNGTGSWNTLSTNTTLDDSKGYFIKVNDACTITEGNLPPLPP